MVRRVQEVIEDPVKDEGVEEELDAERLPDAGVGHPTSRPTCGGEARQRMSRAGSRHRDEACLRIMLMNRRKPPPANVQGYFKMEGCLNTLPGS